jgi:transcriptional regulator with XRE-family HTH domain
VAQTIERLRGLRLDPAALDRAMTVRGLDGRGLARLSGVSADTISRLRRGERVDPPTLRRVIAALEAAPTHPLLTQLAGTP